MLARLQQLTTIGLVVLAFAWAWHHARQGRWAMAVTGALVLLCLHAIVLAFEFVLVAWVNRRDAAPRASVAQLVAAWWGEVTTSTIVFCWRQPFRSRVHPDRPAGRRRGVVLVHGFVCNRGLWNPWLERLHALGVPVVAVNLEPVFGSIDAYARIVDDAVAALERGTGMAPVLVGHSMGGLAIRAWLDRHAADARAHHVVTIGSPHQGTSLARIALAMNARQMRRDGDWLRALAARETPQRRRRFTCFYGHCDNIVLPASTATLPDADNRHLAGVAHVAMAYDDRVLADVMRLLGVADAADVSASRSGDADAWPSRGADDAAR